MKERSFINPKLDVIEADYIIIRDGKYTMDKNSDFVLRARVDVILTPKGMTDERIKLLMDGITERGNTAIFYDGVDNPNDILIECKQLELTNTETK